MTTFRLATCNARKELGVSAAASVVHKAATAADVIVWQEIETDAHVDAVFDLDGFETYWPGGLDKHGYPKSIPKAPANATPISWRTSRFTPTYRNKLKLYTGRRGLSYSRYDVWVVLRDSDGAIIPAQNTHMVAQAWTSRILRRPLWKASARKVNRRTATIIKNYGAIVGGGDMNHKWTPDGTKGVWTNHGTVGTAHYDVLYHAGKIDLVGVPARIPTASDHDILVASFRRVA